MPSPSLLALAGSVQRQIFQRAVREVSISREPALRATDASCGLEGEEETIADSNQPPPPGLRPSDIKRAQVEVQTPNLLLLLLDLDQRPLRLGSDQKTLS